MVDDQEIIEFHLTTNQSMYSFIIETYSTLKEQIGGPAATNILISAIASNLGFILAHIPHDQRKECIDAAFAIVEASIVTAIKGISEREYGQIGNA